MWLTKRQQQVLRELRGDLAVKSRHAALWLNSESYFSARTLYALIDAELAGRGIFVDGVDAAGLTLQGYSLARLLAHTLSRRQQQVLARFRDFGDVDDAPYLGKWLLPMSWDDSDEKQPQKYGNFICSQRTLNVLCDAELVGYSDNDRVRVAALTPRGRRLAELLP